MHGFVKGYSVWIHHGEGVVNDLMDDEANSRYMDACIHELECSIGGHGQGSSDGDRDDGCVLEDGDGGADNIDGGHIGEDDDGDYLEQLLRNTGPEVLLWRMRGEENLERVQRAHRESSYSVEKGCSTHWTILHFVFELLIMKAKYGWSDYSFNDLLHLMALLLLNANSIPANTYATKNL